MTDYFSSVPFPDRYRGGVIVPGNFDGVHHGHRYMLARARDIAAAEHLPVIAVTFEPHPAVFFGGGDVKPFRLTSREQKRALLEENGADYVDILPFDAPLAGMSADDFVTHNIIARYQAKHIVTGHDFVFGNGREGSGTLLRRYADDGAFGAVALEPFLSPQGFTISSSRVREALRLGRPEDAAALAGRPYTVIANVIKGDGVAGTQLGFPTANIDMGDYLRPAYGAYAVDVILRGTHYKAALNIGVRPTMFGTRECTEAHLIGEDVPHDFYGEELTVIWRHFLRKEQRFDSFDALKAAIKADVKRASVM